MRFLRNVSTRRLLALCGGVVAIAAGTATVAVAIGGGGPVPPPEGLASAVHDALSAPSVPGLSARIKFTNHLIDTSGIEGSSLILSGASGRLWASPEGGGRLRLELQSEGGGDSQVLVEGGRFEIYDGGSETVYRGTLPAGGDSSAKGGSSAPGSHRAPSLGEIQRAIGGLGEDAALSGAVPSDVAGQPTYTVRIAPKRDGGLVGGAQIAFDAAHGTPLQAAVYASGEASPVLALEATEVSFEAVPASVFSVSPPPGAKVVELSSLVQPSGVQAEAQPQKGAEPVGRPLGFAPVAPGSLAGLPRADVRKIGIAGKTAALVTYGRGLGGITVIESASRSGDKGPFPSAGLSLPKVSINGAQGEVLDTALGTLVSFSRAGVDYTVLGSVPPAVAEAAARGL